MQLPIVAPAPIVSEHAQAFRHLFNDERAYQHFQHYLTWAHRLREQKSIEY